LSLVLAKKVKSEGKPKKDQFASGLLAGVFLGILGTIFYQQKKDEDQVQFLKSKLADLLKSDLDLEKIFHPPKPKTLSTKTTTPSKPKK
jgi:hypothetical protein